MASDPPKPSSTTSSRAGNNGSANGSVPDKLKTKCSQEPLKRFVCDDRDYRSHAVAEYDAYQVQAKKARVESLKKVVGKEY